MLAILKRVAVQPQSQECEEILSRVIEGFNPAAGGETEGATGALEK